MFSDNETLHICTVASRLAKQQGYEPTGTTMLIKEPTDEHQKVVVGVHCRGLQDELLHIVLLIINDAAGRRLRCVDMHPGRGNWGGSLICATCDEFYPSEQVKLVSTKQTTWHNFEYEHLTGGLRILWKDGQTILTQEEVRDLLLFLHDDLRDDILASREEEQGEKI